MNKDPLLKNHTFRLAPQGNGGEDLYLITNFYANGDPITENSGWYINQEIRLNSYCNSAGITLCGNSINSKALRRLANELDCATKEIAGAKIHGND